MEHCLINSRILENSIKLREEFISYHYCLKLQEKNDFKDSNESDYINNKLIYHYYNYMKYLSYNKYLTSLLN
jgi:hypothetical protein